jgi:hypothetical protein
MRIKYLALAVAPITFFLGGCLTTHQAYLPDGSMGYSITCGGAAFSMSDCQKQAGEICKANGYTIYDKSGEAIPVSGASVGPHGGSAYSGSIMHRSLLVKCGGTKKQ